MAVLKCEVGKPLGKAPILAFPRIQHQHGTEFPMANRVMTSISRRKLLAGTTAATTLLAAPAIVRAQAKALKIGVLLPRSGYMAPTGQASHRGAMIAPKVLSDYGHRVIRAPSRRSNPAEHLRSKSLIGGLSVVRHEIGARLGPLECRTWQRIPRAVRHRACGH
jgi:hypothetical protein